MKKYNKNTFFSKIHRRLFRNSMIKVISFDVFDTVLIRAVPSDYVIELAAKNLKRYVSEQLLIEISVENILKSRNCYAKDRDSGEWTVREWLRSFATDLNIDKSTFTELGSKAEFNAEISGLIPNPKIVTFMQCLRNKKFIKIAVSDTWHDVNDLQSILVHFNFVFDYIFSSGSLKASKNKRTIFNLAEKKLNLNANRFIHIGDNLQLDFLNPRLKRWDSIWIPKRHPFLPFWLPKVFWKGKLRPQPKHFIANLLSTKNQIKSTSALYQMGYSYFVPVLILFSLIQWKIFRKNNIDTVLFIARDAKIPYEAYKSLQPYFPDTYSYHYCRLSRRSIGLLYPGNPFLNAESLPGKVGKNYVGQWFSNFTVNEALKNKLMTDSHLNENSDFNKSAKSSLKKAGKKNKKWILDEILNNSKMVVEYLEDITAQSNFKRIGIVDSGWAGTIQDCLRKVLNETELIFGVYLGVSHQGQTPNSKSYKLGILRDDYRNKPYHYHMDSTAGSVRVWDTLLREPVGTVLEFEKKNDRSIPILNDDRFIGMKERNAYAILIESLRNRIRDSNENIKILINFIDRWKIEELEQASVHFSRRITLYPSQETANAILDLNIEEGTADGQKSSIGVKGLRKGIAWYPGIISSNLNKKLAFLIIYFFNLMLGIFLKVGVKKK